MFVIKLTQRYHCQNLNIANVAGIEGLWNTFSNKVWSNPWKTLNTNQLQIIALE